MSLRLPTPHIGATAGEQIAKTVLMPGDPLRAKYIAENFLQDVVQFNAVRGMFGYTGDYAGNRISVMGSGMGIPSIGIYSYELYAFYGVDNIIRIGSCGSYVADLDVFDVVIAQDAWSESTYAREQSGYNDCIITPSEHLNSMIAQTANELAIKYKKARVHSSDVFYRATNSNCQQHINGCSVVEMEAFGLFANANHLNKHAACILTVSDSFVSGSCIDAAQRQTAFNDMITLALSAATKL
jgi:purine-nucleoside phosphorylase